MQNKLETMFLLQNTANNYASGENWRSGFTERGQEINWPRAARFELVEAIDQSIQYKWWKASKDNALYSVTDHHNLVIELVDAWHFIMSELITIGIPDVAVNEIMQILSSEEGMEEYAGKSLVEAIEGVELALFNDLNNEAIRRGMFTVFWGVVTSVTTVTKFYETYVLKNVLNIFRQQNGYKDGTYIKEWGADKKEDNTFLDSYIANGGVIEYDEIHKYLTETYKSLNQGN